MSKRNRRIRERKKGRRGLVVLGCLAILAIGAGLWLQDGPSSEPPPPPPIPEEELEEQAAEAPPGPQLLPAALVARSALEGIELREGERIEGLPADAFFVLEADVPLPDLRLRLFDEGHRLVPAEEFIEVGATTRYLLQPKEALRAGAEYSLIADGQESTQPSDASGQSYLPARYTVTILGG